ncbi:methionine ABC transporter permease [Leucobacter komagatae]|uniref:Methionine ABC transporter permease n=1 Tax=Leucobacter komagatae TaxID=55969 RepID=A0A0D0H7Z4_9MICO|nr:methionine ABC transporter permease [Leucobacter komagatae]KIP53350.1 methionine ABC transporter permease [Leucobacter komagatae]
MYDYSFWDLWENIIFPGLIDTLIMLAGSAITCGIVGFIVALVLVTTDPRGLRPNRAVYEATSTIVGLLWSLPFIILAISIIPLTRFVVGTSIGVWAAVFAITFAGSPFIARLLESAFKEVNPSLIEAARSLGASDWQITLRVIVPEAVPAMVSQMTLGVITLLGFTAIAGTIGAGGLGAVALTYGYQNFNDQVMYGTALLLVLIVVIIQLAGNALYRKIK